MISPRLTRRFLLGASLGATVASRARAQSGAVRLLVAFPPGGPVDLVARMFGEQLSKVLGQTVIIENKAGANGMLAASEILRAAPDGATVWFSSVGAVAINPALYDKLNYDVVRDFAPVSQVANNVEVFCVNPKNPANSAAEFVANTKARAETTALGSSGIGSIPHLAIEQLALASGAKLLHVPYKGVAPVVSDVISGQIAGVFLDVPGAVSFIDGGQLKPLAVAAPRRHPRYPDLKTLEEQGIKGVDTNNWYGLFVSIKTPPPVIAGLNKAVRAALANPDLSAKMLANGTEPAPSSPEDLAALLKRDTEKWADLIRARNIKIEQ